MKGNQNKFLTMITTPSSVTSLGNFSFRVYEYLGKIQFESTNLHYALIDGILFSKDIRTIVRYPMNKDGDSYTIPSSVTSIRNEILFFCRSLKEITILSSVTSIGDCAFSYCSSLTQITVPI